MPKISPQYLTLYHDIAEEVAALLWRRHRNTPPGKSTRRTPAIAIARLFKLPGSTHETFRRRCRELIQIVRERGYPVLADGRGYYMGSEPGDFATYAALCRRTGLAYLVDGRRVMRTPAAQNAAGQLLMADGAGCLFADAPQPTRSAMACGL